MDRVEFVPWGHLDRFFEAVVQATEEAAVNALAANEGVAIAVTERRASPAIGSARD